MSKMKITYEGNLQTRCMNENGVTLITQAPKEVGGMGEQFSPTDLLAVSLGSCILTLMGMAAKKLKFDLTNTSLEIDKEMSKTPPRRVVKIVVNVHCKMDLTPDVQEKLKQAALTCPVHESLHPDIEQMITFNWD